MTGHYQVSKAYTKLNGGHPYGYRCYSQLTAVKKGIEWPVSPACIADLNVQLTLGDVFFFKVSAGQFLVLIDRRLRSIMKLVRSIVSMRNQMVTSEIIPYFHEYTIWLPVNIMGDELR